jgi:formate-dependent nitrite reductase cytochrome c552 subunit
MIKRLFIRLGYGMLFALPLMLLTFAIALAQSQPESEQTHKLDCKACHSNYHKAWEGGAHAQSAISSGFREAWEEQGSPFQCLTCHVTGYDPETETWESDAISCEACHDASSVQNHPQNPMPTDRSAKMCGDCHQEAFFEWQISSHRVSGLSCIGCHDPHGTELKKGDPMTQCTACHRARASNYAHSEHSRAGLTCADCHLANLPNHLGEGQARLDHSFNVQLSTCNSCHAYQMHDPTDVHPESSVSTVPDAMAAVETLPVMTEPLPVSPVGFATLSGIFGLAAGAILGPWF